MRQQELSFTPAIHGITPAWAHHAWAVLHSICRKQETFTTDDLWKQLPTPDEPRALGKLLQHAKKMGLCEPTDRYIPSQRATCHRRPVRVWRPCRST